MRRNRKIEQEEQQSEGAPEWLLSYSDVMTLLLTFFVMLFSMSIIDKQKFEETARSMRSSFLHKGGDFLFGEGTGNTRISIIEANNSKGRGGPESETGDGEEGKENGIGTSKIGIEEFKKEIEEEIEKANLGGNIKVIDESETLILRLNSVVLFDSGLADIKESAKPILIKTGRLLKSLGKEIEVQGHTDNLPINTLLFPSNWELSTKRATNIVKFFIENCGVPPEKLTASGNAEFRPVAPNDTEENRRKNRRIDIVVLK